ncbi:hypothetical protein F0L74_17495 [Chitinophaga agrisoli]|uniref:Uncharacterized protein n=1 Tax=Chitinophaga agrisoli TaxID=2607653 RepID=A0A5B2VTL6_9BACT|nr:hypothetical protein [Chitinophaga agrisoli]KAA2241672.1 hypothetical protein F0L74_17495 [Chitinophaga agrisoli]
MKKRKNYKGSEVVKRELNGQSVQTYSSLHEAMQLERLSHRRLTAAISNRTIINNHIFTCDSIYRVERQSKRFASTEPWEGNDGMFNIEGWAGMGVFV